MRTSVREAMITYRRLTVDEAHGPIGRRVCQSRDVTSIARGWIGSGTVERFAVFGLDARNRVICAAIIGQGSVTAAPVDMTELARVLILAGAQAFVCAHNHPSGDPSPSAEDVALTRRVSQVGALIGVRLLDHVIVTDDRDFSFLDSAMLPKED